MKVFVSGGCKNGKSTYAEKITIKQKKNKEMYYIATMIPGDDEDIERINNHIFKRKDENFMTIECEKKIHEILDKTDINRSFLIDSMTALLSNEMFEEAYNIRAYSNIINDLKKLLENIENIVIVSDYIYSNAEKYYDFTEEYCKGLSKIDKFCASVCDIVIEVFYGNIIVHKGVSLLEKIN